MSKRIIPLLICCVSLFSSVSVASANPGDPDTSLGAGGVALVSATQGSPLQTVVLPDGSSLVAGTRGLTACGSTVGSVWKVLQTGSTDTSFGTSGRYSVQSSSCNMPARFTSVGTQSNGKIIAGAFISSSGPDEFRVVRLAANGTLDTSFGTNGLISHTFPTNGQLRVHDGSSVMVGGDDSIYIVMHQRNVSTTMNMVVVKRYSADGTLDTSFGTNGVVSWDITTGGPIVSQVVLSKSNIFQPLDRIYVLTRWSASYGVLYKLYGDGSLDNGFGTLSPGAEVGKESERFTIDSYERAVLGATVTNTTNDASIKRLKADGSVDNNFGTSGSVDIDIGTSTSADTFSDVNIAAGSSIAVLSWHYQTSSTSSNKIVDVSVLRPNGNFDTDFSGDGKTTLQFKYNPNLAAMQASRISVAPGESPGFISGQYLQVIAQDNVTKFGTGRVENISAWPDLHLNYERLVVRDDDSNGNENADETVTVVPAPTGLKSGETVTYALHPATPSGISINSSTGAITYSPDAHETDSINSRDLSVTIQASTNFGREIMEEVVVIVLPTDPAQQFRPVLKFDSEEHWRPLDVERFFKDGKPSHQGGFGHPHTICRDTGNDQDYANDMCADSDSDGGDWVTSLSDFKDCNFYPSNICSFNAVGDALNYYIAGPGDYENEESYKSPDNNCVTTVVWECSDSEHSKIYYKSTSHDGINYHDYWMFYRYDDTPSDVSGAHYDHEGDWESVRVASSQLTPYTFDFAVFSAHTGPGWYYLRDALQCVGGLSGTDVGTCNDNRQRPINFVAKGTHASYPRSCSSTVCFKTDEDGDFQTLPWGFEDRFDGSESWLGNNTTDSLVNFDSAETAADWVNNDPDRSWTTWPGWWGAYNLSWAPQSPGQRPVRFFSPWLHDNCSTRWSANECVRASFTATLDITDPSMRTYVFNPTIEGPAVSSGWDFTGMYSLPSFSSDDLSPKSDSGPVSSVTKTFTTDGDHNVTLEVKDASGYAYHVTHKICVVTCSAATRSAQATTDILRKKAASCARWNGPFVVASICKPDAYEDWLQSGRKSQTRKAVTPGGRSTIAIAPGLTQVLDESGVSLNNKIVLPDGADNDSIVTVKSTRRGRTSVATFYGYNLPNNAIITAHNGRNGFPAIRVKHGTRSWVPVKSRHSRR